MLALLLAAAPTWTGQIADAEPAEIAVAGDFYVVRCRDAWASVHRGDGRVSSIPAAGEVSILADQWLGVREGDSARVHRLSDGRQIDTPPSPPGSVLFPGRTLIFVAQGADLHAYAPEGGEEWSVTLRNCDTIGAIAEIDGAVIVADSNSDARVTRNLVTIVNGRIRGSQELGFTGAVIRNSAESGLPIEVREMRSIDDAAVAQLSDGNLAVIPARGRMTMLPLSEGATWSAHAWGRETWLRVGEDVVALRTGRTVARAPPDAVLQGPWLIAPNGASRMITDLRRGQATCQVPAEAVINDAHAALMEGTRVAVVDAATGRSLGTYDAPAEGRIVAVADRFLLVAGGEAILLNGVEEEMRVAWTGDIAAAHLGADELVLVSTSGAVAGFGRW